MNAVLKLCSKCQILGLSIVKCTMGIDCKYPAGIMMVNNAHQGLEYGSNGRSVSTYNDYSISFPIFGVRCHFLLVPKIVMNPSF